MVLRELFVRLGLQVDESAFAKGTLAANALSKAVGVAMNFASNAVRGLDDALIGFNARAEQAKMGLAGIAGMNLKLPWEEAKKAADELYAGLQEDAAKTPAETAELVDFSQQIAGAYLAAGKNMKDLRQFTTQAVVAAKMLKAEGTAATDIKQAIQGRVGVKDMFAANVINSLGMSIEAFNAKSMQERADLFAKGLNNPTIRAAMEEYETQWDGITSTIKDNVSIILGEIGKPLFGFLKRTLGGIGAWVQRNRDPIVKFFKAWAASVGDFFDRVYKAGAFVVRIFMQAGQGVKFLYGEMNTLRAVISRVVDGFRWLWDHGGKAAAQFYAAWRLAMSPFTALFLILDDIRGYMDGEDSLIGRFAEWLKDWQQPRQGDTWFIVQLKEFVRYITEAIDLLKELDSTFGDGSKARAMNDKRAGIGSSESQRRSDNQTLSTATQRLGMGLPLTDAAKAALGRSGVTEAAFVAKYSPSARAVGGSSVTAPVQIHVTQAPGENGENFARRVGEVVTTFWNGQLEAAGAGVRR